MKKTLFIVCLLVFPFLAPQFFSLDQVSRWRAWVDSFTQDELVVGVSWPFKDNQDGMDEGLLLAQSEINRYGVRGKRIRLDMRDDHLDREISRRITVDFSRNLWMTAIIGYYDDDFAVRASAVFEESHQLHIITGANNSYMTSHGFRYLIRSVLPSTRIGRKLAELCLARGYRTYAIIAEDGPFGDDLAYQFGAELDSKNAHAVYQTSIQRSKTDFREMVDELKGTNADVIIFISLEEPAAVFIKTARDMGLRTPIVGSFSDTPKLRQIAGKTLEGSMYFDIYDVNSPTPQNRSFVEKYRKRYGALPDAYAAQGYDALRILARAVEITGSKNALDLSYAIRFMGKWEGANGTYVFDDRGELGDKPIYLLQYRNGRPEVIAKSQDGSEPPAVPSELQQAAAPES